MTKRKYNRAFWMGEASHEAAAPEEMQKMVSCKVKRYRIERTKKEVRAITPSGADTTGVTDVTIVWDEVEGIGLELPPYGDIVADPKRGESPFITPEGRQHAEDVAREIEKYVKQNNIV